MNFFETVRKKALLDIDYLLRGNQKSFEESIKLLSHLLDLNKPKNFNNLDPVNDIMKQKKSFQALCITLEEHGCVSPGKLFVFDFYSRLDSYRKKAKKTNNSL